MIIRWFPCRGMKTIISVDQNGEGVTREPSEGTEKVQLKKKRS